MFLQHGDVAEQAGSHSVDVIFKSSVSHIYETPEDFIITSIFFLATKIYVYCHFV